MLDDAVRCLKKNTGLRRMMYAIGGAVDAICWEYIDKPVAHALRLIDGFEFLMIADYFDAERTIKGLAV